MNIYEAKSFKELTIRGKSRRIREIIGLNNDIRMEHYKDKMVQYYDTKDESILDDIRNEIMKNKRRDTINGIDKLF